MRDTDRETNTMRRWTSVRHNTTNQTPKTQVDVMFCPFPFRVLITSIIIASNKTIYDTLLVLYIIGLKA